MLDMSYADFMHASPTARLEMLRGGAEPDVFAMRLHRHADELLRDVPAGTVEDFLVACAAAGEAAYAVAVVRESNPTWPAEQRIVKSDEALAELILRCAAAIDDSSAAGLARAEELAELLPETAAEQSACVALRARIDVARELAQFDLPMTIAQLAALQGSVDAQQKLFVRLCRKGASRCARALLPSFMNRLSLSGAAE